MIRQKTLIILGKTQEESKEFYEAFSSILDEYVHIVIASTSERPGLLIGHDKPYYTLVGSWHLGRYAQQIIKLMKHSHGEEVFYASLGSKRLYDKKKFAEGGIITNEAIKRIAIQEGSFIPLSCLKGNKIVMPHGYIVIDKKLSPKEEKKIIELLTEAIGNM